MSPCHGEGVGSIPARPAIGDNMASRTFAEYIENIRKCLCKECQDDADKEIERFKREMKEENNPQHKIDNFHIYL